MGTPPAAPSGRGPVRQHLHQTGHAGGAGGDGEVEAGAGPEDPRAGGEGDDLSVAERGQEPPRQDGQGWGLEIRG